MQTKNKVLLFLSCIFILAAIVLRAIPVSLALPFAPSPDVVLYQYHSYFSFGDLYGFGVVFQPTVAIFSVAWLPLSVCYPFHNKKLPTLIIGFFSCLCGLISVFWIAGTVFTVYIGIILVVSYVLQIIGLRNGKTTAQ